MDKIKTKRIRNIFKLKMDIKEAASKKKKSQKVKCLWRIVIPIGSFVVITSLIVSVFYNDLAYAFAQWRFNSGDWAGAKRVFLSIGDYNNSQDYMTQILYADACDFMASRDYHSAVNLFISLNGFSDSKVLLDECYNLMADDYYQNGDYDNAVTYFSKINHADGIKKTCIAWADQLYKDCDYTRAINLIKPFSGCVEIDTRISQAEYEIAYNEAVSSNHYAAVVKLNYLNYDERAHEAAVSLMHIDPRSTETMAVSQNHIIYLKTDGKVHADGSNSHGQCDVTQWSGVVSLCASELNTYALVYDGTVLATGSNAFGQCNVSDWTNIIALCASDNALFGLQRDGTVIFAGGESGQYDALSEWTHISAISAGKDHVVAVNHSGNVFAAGNNEYGQCDITEISGISSVSCGPYRTMLISTDGKLTIYGVYNEELKNSVLSWSNITSASSSHAHIVAKDDMGNLFATGSNSRGQCNVAVWKEVAFFFARANFTVAVTFDGSVETSVDGHALDWEVLIWK